MSIAAMADNHVLMEARKPTPRSAAPAKQDDPDKPQGVSAGVVNQLTLFIPTEVITLWVAFIAVVHFPKAAMGQKVCQADFSRLWYPLIAFAVFASLLTLGLTYRKWKDNLTRGQRFRPPIFEMAAAPFAFLAWAISLPHSPLQSACWYSVAAGAAIVTGTTVLITTVGYIFGKTQRFQKTA